MRKEFLLYALMILLLFRCGGKALIEITEPGNNALVNGTVKIIAQTASSSVLDSIQYYIDDEYLASVQAWSDTCLWDTRSFLHASLHNISAVGFFANGLIAESDIISVTVYSHRTVLAEVFGEYF